MKISLHQNPIKIASLIYYKMAPLALCLTEEMIPLLSFSNPRKGEAPHPISQDKGISNGNSLIVLSSTVAHHCKLMAVRMTSIMTRGIQLCKLYRTMKTFQILKRPIKSSKSTLKHFRTNKSTCMKRIHFQEKSEKCQFLLPDSKFG